jgi:SAM-dependent methyltransferase
VREEGNPSPDVSAGGGRSAPTTTSVSAPLEGAAGADDTTGADAAAVAGATVTVAPRREPSLDDFLGEPTRDLADWRWLWDGDRRFPVRSHRGVVGRLLVLAKRLFRPLVQVPQNDLWERQRVFNLILLEHLAKLSDRVSDNTDRVRRAEAILQDGLDEVMRHNDALFSRVDAKLDAYRHDARELLATLRSALMKADVQGEANVRALGNGDSAAQPVSGVLARTASELAYVEFEGRFRGTEVEIAERLAVYLPHLAGASPLLDLGCGRGEALRVFSDAGLTARGIDSSAEMVARCRERGLDASEGDVVSALAATPPGSLGAVVSFHVVEHLPPAVVERLVALAFAALRPGGVLVLETPNPLSLVVAARNFWIDPTHRRPVHPETLRQQARQHGFDPVEILELRPFPEAERLPEIPLESVPPEAREIADRVNRLRDRLDDLLFGHQDYGLIARRP